MPEILNKKLSISNHARTRIAERLGMQNCSLADLKTKLSEALKRGEYRERQVNTDRSVFRCLIDTDRAKREELFVVLSDDNCVVTVIDRKHVFRNRYRRWQA